MRHVGTALLLLVCDIAIPGQKTSVPTFVIDRPTIIAFFRPVSDEEMDKNPDINEALGDFQLYASRVGRPLKNAGIDFEVASAVRFRVKDGGSVRTFNTGKIGVGYYFIAPGNQPHVEYGVETDPDILEAAKKYFQLPIAAP
jgi:hypothetical protein